MFVPPMIEKPPRKRRGTVYKAAPVERPAGWYWIRGAMGVGVEPGEWSPALGSPSRGVWRSAGFEATAGLVEVGEACRHNVSTSVITGPY